jgi:hypothetical protein
MLVREALEAARTRVLGAQIDEFSVLAQPYTVGSNTVSLQYPKPNVGPGSTLVAGLNSFTVMASDATGATHTVLPSADGGPEVAVPAGERVRIKPKFTNWQLYQEMRSELEMLSSPEIGLYAPAIFEADAIDRVSGMYAVPVRTDGLLPFRLVKAEYKQIGRTTWLRFAEAEYQATQNAVRVLTERPIVSSYRFTLAFPYGLLNNDIAQDLSTIGINDQVAHILSLAAATAAAVSFEGRRVQPVAQTDTRRATEVPAGGSTAVARTLMAAKVAAIQAEQARLIGLSGYTMSVATPNAGSTWRFR